MSNKTPNISANHDTFFRGSLSNIDIARDFFAAHLDADLLKRVQLETLKLEPGTSIDEVHKELRSDVLYSASIDNKPGYLYLVVEHQSRSDRFMGFRLLHYACRIWQCYLDKQAKLPHKLPVILPMVIYNGKISPYDQSTILLDCFIEPELIRYFLFDQFKLIDLTVIPDEELAQHRKAALMELLEKHIRAKDILPILEFISDADVWGEIKNLENGKYLRFALKYLVDKSETTEIDEAVELLVNKIPEKESDIMTIAEALEQRGFQKGLALAHQATIEIARNLLSMGMSEEEIAKITKLPASEIKTLH